jgi:hypothetical protein
MVITCLAGIIFALVLWRRAALASIYLIVACIVSLVGCLLYPTSEEMIIVFSRGWSPQAANAAWDIFSIAWSILRAVTYILLIVAIYVGRSTPPNTALEPTPTAP